MRKGLIVERLGDIYDAPSSAKEIPRTSQRRIGSASPRSVERLHSTATYLAPAEYEESSVDKGGHVANVGHRVRVFGIVRRSGECFGTPREGQSKLEVGRRRGV